MYKLKQLLFPAFIILCLSCKNDRSHTYAIKDFRKSLQPHLIQIVSEGIVEYYDSSLENMLTDKELVQLGQSEHPVLRASAFREMLQRKSFDHFDVLMSHLADTAIVATDAGEWGIWYQTVSDYILQEAKWKTQEAKNKTVEQVLTRHNYLRSAYHILPWIEPREKYYPFIKDMATRPRRLSEEGYELGFDDIEYALYGLAKFKQKEDVMIIKNSLMKHVGFLSDMSFRLMKEFPDTAYLDVLQDYHYRQFYMFPGNRRGGFTGFYEDRTAPEDFIKALAAQQNEGSARLLDTMLTRLSSQTCFPDRVNIVDEVIMEIWEHPCPAYARLRRKIKTKAEEILKKYISIPFEDLEPIEKPMEKPDETAKENIRW